MLCTFRIWNLVWWRAATVFHELEEQEQHKGQRDLLSWGSVLYTERKEKIFFKINAWEVRQVSSAPSSKSWSFFPFTFSLYAFHQKSRSFYPLHSCSDQSFKLTKPHGKGIFYLWQDEARVLTTFISPCLLPSESALIFISGILSVGEPKKPPSGFAISTRLEPYSHMQTMGSDSFSNPLDILTKTKLHYDVWLELYLINTCGRTITEFYNISPVFSVFFFLNPL